MALNAKLSAVDSSPLLHFGLVDFVAASAPDEKVGSNGLPVTPATTNIIGRFQLLKRLQHRNLCQYLNIYRGRHDRLMVISEHYPTTLAEATRPVELAQLKTWTFQILTALDFLHSHGIAHRNMSLKNICLGSNSQLKLSNFGLYYICQNGVDIEFPIGCPETTAPELIKAFPEEIGYELSLKADVWSFGMVLLELALGHSPLKLNQSNGISNVHNVLQAVVDFCSPSGDSHRIEQRHVWGESNDHSDGNNFISEDLLGPLDQIDSNLRSFVEAALDLNPYKRPSVRQLATHPFLAQARLSSHPSWLLWPPLRSERQQQNLEPFVNDPLLKEWQLSHIFYLWHMAIGPIDSLITTASDDTFSTNSKFSTPPIFQLPRLGTESLLDDVSSASDQLSQLQKSSQYSGQVRLISLDPLRQRFARLSEIKTPAIPTPSSASTSKSISRRTTTSVGADLYDINKVNFLGPEFDVSKTAANLPPLSIRERDFDYQFQRVKLFNRLLSLYPLSLAEIQEAARQDIPPLLRARVWSALLGVEGDTLAIFDSVDKVTESSIDRQIDVDIPRCHQYHVLLASSEGHRQLRRLLKCWVKANDKLVYWQGLDSVCAPFLVLHFNQEHEAFACIQSFIPRFLNDFFAYDNSHVLQDSLAVFRHLLSFHDAELAAHMDDIGFLPELFAIPWFLTLYTHVFPMDKIFHLFDRLLVSPPSLSLYVGIAILYQLRTTLLAASFNESILLFSDSPNVDMEACLSHAVAIARQTPPSIVHRIHDRLAEDITAQEEQQQNWWEKPIPLEDKKAELAARLSLRDFLQLRPMVTVIDIRDEEEFSRAHVPNAWNIHIEELDDVEAKLREEVRPYVVVVANRGKSGPAFGRRLVYRRLSRVCVLNGGMDALRTAQASRSMSLCTCRPVPTEIGQISILLCSLVRPQ